MHAESMKRQEKNLEKSALFSYRDKNLLRRQPGVAESMAMQSADACSLPGYTTTCAHSLSDGISVHLSTLQMFSTAA